MFLGLFLQYRGFEQQDWGRNADPRQPQEARQQAAASQLAMIASPLSHPVALPEMFVVVPSIATVPSTKRSNPQHEDNSALSCTVKLRRKSPRLVSAVKPEKSSSKHY